LIHWFVRSSLFWAFCIFWLSVLSDVWLANIFSQSVGGLFNLETIFVVVMQKFLISCSSICPSFLLVAGLLEFYWESPCLYLLFPEYSLLFHVLTIRFQVWY
jgi:hypothetical protein